ncbi:MAG: radical SAM protein [Nanoarchaeota archaeon]|nr:radical SAM protein [Nanoarchaeota archaeon]
MDKIEVSMPLYEARLSLTGRCNHQCIYCGPFSDGKADKGYKDLSLDQIRDIASLLKDKGLHIQLTGGEPTLRKDLAEIVEILSNNGITDIGLTTNGSMISPEYAQRLLGAGISDFHIHVPSLNYDVFRKTTKDKRQKVVDVIIQTALYLKREGEGVEFNTPITQLNLPTVPQLIDFCYSNEINLKLIEEVNLANEQVTEGQIIQTFEDWFKNRGLELDETKINKRYGRIYDLGNFSFRVAPATKGLVDFLNKKNEAILYDGRYWIGGKDNRFVFTPSYFLKTKTGSFKGLERNLNETIQIYNDHGKK